jgi:hypothetical protein
MELPSLSFLTQSRAPAQAPAQPTRSSPSAARQSPSAPLMTSSGLALPDLGFGFSRSNSTSVAAAPVIETSFFSQCRIQLKSSNPKIGVKRDTKGSIVISPNPSVIKFTVERHSFQFAIADRKLEIRRRSDLCFAMRDSTKSVVTLWFKMQIVSLSFLATIYLHKRQDGEAFLDGFKGEGHPINDRDDYDVLLTTWKFKTATQLGDLIEDRSEFDSITIPSSIRPLLNGLQDGGLRFVFLKKKVVAVQIKQLREFKPRVRIPVIWDRLNELQKLSDELLEVTETRVKRQRVQNTVAAMKARMDELTAAVDTNTLMIEQMHEEKEQFQKKMSEVERAKRRIDVDESEKQMGALKEHLELRAAMNHTTERSEDLDFELMRYSGTSALLAKCVSDAFVVMCAAMAASEEQALTERLESANRLIAESVFL